MTADDEVVVGPLGPFSGGGGGGGGDAGSLIRIVNKLTSRAFSVMNGVTVEIKFNWTSTDTSDEQPTGDGSATWRINGTKVATQAVSQGDCAFDVTKYLTPASANTIKLTIEDAYGNSKSFTWTVTVSTYDLAWNLGTLAFHGSSVLTVRLTPTGEGTKTIHMTVDGTEAFTREVTTTGRSVTATIDPTALELTHGAHTVEAWLEVTTGGEVVTTTHLRHVGIWTKSDDNTPVIAVYQSAIEIQQFATGSINYMVYDPTSTTATVRLLEGYNTLSTLTVDRTIPDVGVPCYYGRHDQPPHPPPARALLRRSPSPVPLSAMTSTLSRPALSLTSIPLDTATVRRPQSSSATRTATARIIR